MTEPHPLAHTTMYKIASLLLVFQTGERGSLADLSPEDRDQYFKQAVRLFDEAEPVWRDRVGIDLTSAYFRGAESMAEQVEEDHGIRVKPEFVSPYGEQEYADWKAARAS